MGADAQFDVVYRGQVMNHIIPGRAVFFQRLKEYGGGYWFGRTYSDYYEFLIERPVSLGEGIDFLIHANAVAARHMEFDDDFKLEG